ncbi:MAG: hypothetical protein AAGF54_09360 [Pseudomonadota bacterium]
MIKVTPADISSKADLKSMMDTYFDEMFEMQGLTPTEIDALGPYPYYDLYWTEEERIPYVIWSNKLMVGFSLVRTGDMNEIAEFYVSAQNRKTGIGQEAAFQVFDHHRGLWDVSVLKENTAGQTFWRKVISDYTNGNFTETQASEEPKGIKFRFSN